MEAKPPRLSWRRGRYQINLFPGGLTTVDGSVLGHVFGVHDEHRDTRHVDQGRPWSLTHIPSGHMVAALPSKSKAQALARVLMQRPAMWQKVKRTVPSFKECGLTFAEWSWAARRIWAAMGFKITPKVLKKSWERECLCAACDIVDWLNQSGLLAKEFSQ